MFGRVEQPFRSPIPNPGPSSGEATPPPRDQAVLPGGETLGEFEATEPSRRWVDIKKRGDTSGIHPEAAYAFDHVRTRITVSIGVRSVYPAVIETVPIIGSRWSRND